jgi:hypothetical protein
MRLLRAAAVIVTLATCPWPAAAQDAPPPAPSFVERLPRTWCGVFRWAKSFRDQQVLITFTELKPRADGRIAARGHGAVRSGQNIAYFDVEATIDPATLEIEMAETTRLPPRYYATDGTHRGTLSPDLRTMSLTFVSLMARDMGWRRLAAQSAPGASDCAMPST